MSAKDAGVIVGGEPRIDFLPPEIRQKKAARRTVRGLIMLVGAVLAACLVAYAATTTIAIASQVSLENERSRTQELLQQQGQYSDARSASATVESAKNARLVASAQEVLWAPYLAEVVKTLPADSVITSVEIDSISATEAPPVPKEGIELPRKGSLILDGTFPSLSAIATWVENVESLRGFAGYSVSQAAPAETGGYTVQLSLHIDEAANELLYFDKSDPGTGEANSEEEAGQE